LKHKTLDSTIQLHVRARLFDGLKFDIKDLKKDDLLYNSGWLPAKSIVQQYLLMAHCAWSGETTSITDTGGTPRVIISARAKLSLAAAAGDSTYGVVIGTGVTAPANTDTKITTQIAQGSGGGQLLHGTTGFVWGNIAGNIDEIVSRLFTNASGATVTGQEVGIYGSNATDNWKFCIAHDLLTLAILNTTSGCIEYRVRTTV